MLIFTKEMHFLKLNRVYTDHGLSYKSSSGGGKEEIKREEEGERRGGGGA